MKLIKQVCCPASTFHESQSFFDRQYEQTLRQS